MSKPDRTSVKRVTDAATLKAIAHPLRVRMLGELRMEGPATASELGRRFGESSGTTSYHLRVLEKAGFIEADPEQPNARDKRWRAMHMYTSWKNSEFQDGSEGAEFARAMRRRQLENVIAATERFEEEAATWGPAWMDAAGHSDHGVRLTPAAAGELIKRIGEIVREYETRSENEPGAELVRVFVAGFPVGDTDN
ncbi:transcriptional regulator [Actinorhabdospora filicis]|uniref:Transcriptional regulator n=1 Tax=Actinorhabdospora filicis TaxID=1785913 RepID=A0A9W6WBF2_9ACTN|nr:helix-turn-helix domain-containing protein [Actinorhabdospora filicis]GLZ79506.1 transcriptional regulator [Actinorhabdospora filicis]